MSLIHTIRKQKEFKPRHLETSQVCYNPLFLRKAIKGGFVMHKDTLEIEKMECMRKEKREFAIWLTENKLRIKKSEIADHYVICR